MQIKPTSKASKVAFSRPQAGFSIVELLVVISTISILAALLLPALRQTRARSHAIGCLSNLKQLQVAWMMYADDNDGNLVPNTLSPGVQWVKAGAALQLKASDLTNTVFLTDPRSAAFSKYIKEKRIYRCPGDDSTVLIGTRKHQRVRSYTLSWQLGDSPERNGSINRLSDITYPSPSLRFAFIDTHQGWSGLNYFMSPPPEALHQFNSMPASFHGRIGTLSFADGHVELTRWRDPRTFAPRTTPDISSGLHPEIPITSVNNSDIAWLSERGSSR
jgi:prepilin-type processing-associated H-X9-DG protein